AVTALKATPGPDLQVIGSGNLVQTLQSASLIDEYNVWTFPVVLGRGKRLFSETAKPSALRLVRSQVSTTGVVMSTYVPGGEIRLGSFASAEPSEGGVGQACHLPHTAGQPREPQAFPSLRSSRFRMELALDPGVHTLLQQVERQRSAAQNL